MFEEVIPKATKNSLESLSRLPAFKAAYLAGGTALALQLGHRYSYDLDFFTPERFDERLAVQRILKSVPKFKLERQGWGTILGFVGRVKFSLFFYQYPLLDAPQEFYGIRIAGIRDIGAMKIAAIADRGTKRDFIDIYFMIKEGHFSSLKEMLDVYDRKFKKLAQNKVHIVKSLGYFEDAEPEVMPKMIKEVSWKEVKKFFLLEQGILARQLFR